MTLARITARAIVFTKDLPAKTKAIANVTTTKTKSFLDEVKAEEAKLRASRQAEFEAQCKRADSHEDQ